MIRYLPPKGTAGLARSCDRMERRSPSPPARMMAIVRFTVRVRLHVTWVPWPDASTGRGSKTLRGRIRSAERAVPAERAGLQEEPGVHEVAVELDHPVEMRACRVAGAALVADDLPLLDRLSDVHRSRRLHVGVPGLQRARMGDHDDPRRVRAVGPVPA